MPDAPEEESPVVATAPTGSSIDGACVAPSLDLTTATAADLVGWLRRGQDVTEANHSTRTAEEVAGLALLLAVGITDVSALARLDETSTRQVRDMLDTGQRNQVTAADLPVLARIGWRAYTSTARPAWTDVAACLEEDRQGWQARQEPMEGQYAWSDDDAVPDYLNAVIEHGRTPEEITDLLGLARQCEVVPDVYGTEVTPTQFTMLALAGITSPSATANYALAGLDLAQAAVLAQRGIGPGAALAGVHLDIPVGQWDDLLAGLPQSWFPTVQDSYDFARTNISRAYPVRHGPLGHEYTLADLRYLSEHGWQDVPGRHLVRINGSGHDDDVRLTPATARYLADQGVTPREAAAMVWALAKRSRERNLDGRLTQPALLIRANANEHAETIVGLVHAGVAPKHLTDYRYAGCTDVSDVHTALEAGITGKVAAMLRQTHGTSKFSSDSKRIASLTALLDIWERVSLDRYEDTAPEEGAL